MKKLLILLCFYSQVIFCHTNHTFLKIRPPTSNFPIKAPFVMKLNLMPPQNEFTVAPFFQHSQQLTKTGTFFLFKEKDTIIIKASLANYPAGGVDNRTTKGRQDDIDTTYISHSAGFNQRDVDDFNAMNLSMSMHPLAKVYGTHVHYYQCFQNAAHRFFIFAQTSIVQLERSHSYELMGRISDIDEFEYDEEFTDFLLGKHEQPVVNTALRSLAQQARNGRGQVKMTNAKFSNQPLYSTGFSDIDAGLGYVLFDQPAYYLSGACVVTLSAGNKPKGEFVFEPIRGNGGHVGIGVTADGWVRLLAERKRDLKVVGALDWRYLFSAHEMRTLGLKNRDWGHYYNLGMVGQAPMIPAANILTRSVDVRPGSYLEGMLGLSYHDKEFVADIGYDVYVRARESVRLLDFPDNTYAVAARGHSTALGLDANGQPVPYPWSVPVTVVPKPYTIAPNTVDQGDVALSTVNLHTIDTGVAESPSQCINAIYGSLGFVFPNEPSATTLLSLGGMYEFPTSNAALEQWTLWVKLGVGF